MLMDTADLGTRRLIMACLRRVANKRLKVACELLTARPFQCYPRSTEGKGDLIGTVGIMAVVS